MCAAAPSEDCATSPLGPLKLADIRDPEKREKHIRKCVKELRAAVLGLGAAALPGRAGPGGRSPGSTWSGSAIR